MANRAISELKTLSIFSMQSLENETKNLLIYNTRIPVYTINMASVETHT